MLTCASLLTCAGSCRESQFG